jgi:Na+/H+-dicarboxylate symporter
LNWPYFLKINNNDYYNSSDAIGTGAPVTELAMTAFILNNVGIPLEHTWFIQDAGKILDAFQSAVNVCRDACCQAMIVK